MSNDKPASHSKTELGHTREKKSDLAVADTLPGTQPFASIAPNPSSEDLVTSAPVSTITGTSNTSGSVTLSGERLAEPLARELIVRAMNRAGIDLRPDHTFSSDNLLVTLDGYDPERKIGYQFLSHADADVVTDFAPKVEERLRELGAQDVAHVLIIHDYDARDGDAVLARVEAFLAAFREK